jgi:hypothetical protein
MSSRHPSLQWFATGPSEHRATVELWTSRRTPFITDQSPEQKAMVAALERRVRELHCQPGDRLHGIFTSDEVRSRQPDAENITFYNFGTRPFAGARRSLGFERSYRRAPLAPTALTIPARYYHSWRVVPDDALFAEWVERGTVAEWHDVPIDLDGDLGLSTWRALRENPRRVTVHDRLCPNEQFAAIVSLAVPASRLPSVVTAMKGMVDGPLAGLQRADHLPGAVMSKLVRRRWGRAIDEQALLALTSSHEPRPVLPRAPFNANGLDPCDENCVAGIVRLLDTDADASLSGRVVRVSPR